MNKKQIQKKWQKIKNELFNNKLKIKGIYPSNIVRKRELLLFMQVYLDKIIDSRTYRINDKFYTKIYKKLKKCYIS